MANGTPTRRWPRRRQWWFEGFFIACMRKLLPSHCHWPCGRRAAQKCNELATSHASSNVRVSVAINSIREW